MSKTDLIQKNMGEPRCWQRVRSSVSYKTHAGLVIVKIGKGIFYWWKKQEDPEKTADLLQVTDKLISPQGYWYLQTTSVPLFFAVKL